ncbi:hypothetical protein [Maribacter sp. 2307ULW6-5]|uniref:hypothetical protein n=1 Tax=Maribacter sp. 2307ULW6-5 TaxID=3386275 RepID=UPI0039BC3318
MKALKQGLLIYFMGFLSFMGCKPANEKKAMEKEEKQLIDLCLTFAKRADALEKRAFENGEYRLKQFVPDFNTLFAQYADGTMNRTISGLNFRNPPRYHDINTAIRTKVAPLSETRYQVIFEGVQKWRSIRFTIDKRQSEWKLLHFETYVGIANHGTHKGEEIWSKHKL